MMRYGIPAYRLPRDVLGAEIDRLTALGVRFTNNHRVTDLEAERQEGRFDAVFVAVGAHLSKRVQIPAMDAGPMVDAVSFLRGVASGERPVVGRRVAVYGGGNAAMDAARTARRLGAEEAIIVYRRTREQMPAHEEEAEDAEREGVRMNWLRTIKAFEGETLQVEVMELDETGFPQPTGRFETLEADAQRCEAIDFGAQHVARQPVGGDAIAHHPARLLTGVPDLHLMPQPGQMAGGRQAARAGADHQHPPAGSHRRRIEQPALLERRVAQEALDGVDRHRAVQAGAVAVALTRVVTDPPVDSGERVVRDQGPPRPLVLAVLNLGQIALDVLARRTGRVARRQQVHVDGPLGAHRPRTRVAVQQVGQGSDVRCRATR